MGAAVQTCIASAIKVQKLRLSLGYISLIEYKRELQLERSRFCPVLEEWQHLKDKAIVEQLQDTSYYKNVLEQLEDAKKGIELLNKELL